MTSNSSLRFTSTGINFSRDLTGLDKVESALGMDDTTSSGILHMSAMRGINVRGIQGSEESKSQVLHSKEGSIRSFNQSNRYRQRLPDYQTSKYTSAERLKM